MLADKIISTQKNHRRFFGRPSRPCRNCRGIEFYVNRAGGILCSNCRPGEESVGTLYSVDGYWSEFPPGEGDPFEPVETAYHEPAVNGIHPGVYAWLDEKQISETDDEPAIMECLAWLRSQIWTDPFTRVMEINTDLTAGETGSLVQRGVNVFHVRHSLERRERRAVERCNQLRRNPAKFHEMEHREHLEFLRKSERMKARR